MWVAGRDVVCFDGQLNPHIIIFFTHVNFQQSIVSKIRIFNLIIKTAIVQMCASAKPATLYYCTVKNVKIAIFSNLMPVLMKVILESKAKLLVRYLFHFIKINQEDVTHDLKVSKMK